MPELFSSFFSLRGRGSLVTSFSSSFSIPSNDGAFGLIQFSLLLRGFLCDSRRCTGQIPRLFIRTFVGSAASGGRASDGTCYFGQTLLHKSNAASIIFCLINSVFISAETEEQKSIAQYLLAIGAEPNWPCCYYNWFMSVCVWGGGGAERR